eukprot:4574371-Ditylum_brightwellii.AAC.1
MAKERDKDDCKKVMEKDYKKDKGKEKERAPDECHLPKHNHKWKDCKNNPRSDNYKGTYCKDV